jgi:hypothetical protein
MATLSIWHGVFAAWSDASALHVSWIVNQWRDGRGPVFTPQLWQENHDALQSALETSPENPQFLEDLGFLCATRAQGLGSPSQGSQELLLQEKLFADAETSYRAATTLRPTFPYSWAYLALAKHLQHHHDAEFWLAFDKALKFGTNEAGVQPTLAQLAFSLWLTLGGDRQRDIVHMVDTAQATSRKRLLEMAEQNGVTLPVQ